MLAFAAHAAFLILAAGLALNIGVLLWRHADTLQVAADGRRRRRLETFGGLVVLGYGLVAVGAAVLLLMFGEPPRTVLDVAVFVGMRLGAFLIILGVTHFKCLTVLSRTAGASAAAVQSPRPAPARPRRAREDPLDRVLEAARLNAPSGL